MADLAEKRRGTGASNIMVRIHFVVTATRYRLKLVIAAINSSISVHVFYYSNVKQPTSIYKLLQL
jgi:hypothetical protein